MAYNPNNPNGQDTSANSAPVVIANDQSTIPVSVSGVATAANQTTGNTSVGNVDTNIGAKADTSASTDTGTFSLIALIKRLLGKTPALGSTTSANSSPVVIASDQTVPVSVSGVATAANQSTEITALNQIHTDLIAALPSGSNTIGNVNVLGGNVTAVKTDGSAVTQPISAAALPLPSGAATSANQTTIGSQTTKLNDGTNTVAVKAASTAAIAADPALVVAVSPNNTVKVDGSAVTQPVSGTVTVQQATATNLKVDLSGTAANATAIKVDNSAVTQPVSGTVTSNQGGTWTVQPGNTANTTAWKVDGSAVTQPVSGTVTAQQSTAANLKAQVSQNAAITTSSTLQSAAAATGNGSTLSVDGMSSVIFTVSGVFVGTVNFEGTEDGTNYSALSCVQLGATSIVTQTSSTGLFQAECSGLVNVRARVSAWTSGTITVTAHASPVAFAGKTVNANQAGTWTVQPGNTANTTPWNITQQDNSASIAISANATSSGQIYSLNNAATGLLSITGTFVATLQVQLTADNTTWNNVSGNALVFNISTGGWVSGGNITSPGFYFINIAGLTGIRVITTAYTSGTITGVVRATGATYMSMLSNALLPTTLGQQAASASLPVTLSNENFQDLYVTGQSAQTATVNNIIAVTAGTTPVDAQAYRAFAVQVVSTGTGGTYIFEGSNDNTNFQAIPVYNQALAVPVPIVTAITATASQIIYQGSCTMRYVRLRIATTITGGSIQAFAIFTQTPLSAAQTVVAQGTAANLNVTASIAATQTLSTVTTVGTVTTLSQFAASAAAADGTANPTSTLVRSTDFLFNGTTWDRYYNNTEVTLLASAARTTTQTSADIINYNWKKLTVVLDMTVVGTGSVTVTINGKDTASGKYRLLLSGAAITTNSTNVYKVGETISAVANSIAQDYMPRIIQIVVTANNANTATYSVGYNFGL